MKLRHALLTAALAATLLAGGAGATAHEQNGLIAFSRERTFVLNRPVRREIWVANPDGTGLRRLTTAPPNVRDLEPHWGPNGSRLVFDRCTPLNGDANTDHCTIWTVNADGSGKRRLSPACRESTAAPCPVDGGGGGAVY